jgi:hypothetical protein
MVWVIFGVIILIKNRFGMSPRSTALASVIGFISVVAIYAGVVMFLIR